MGKTKIMTKQRALLSFCQGRTHHNQINFPYLYMFCENYCDHCDDKARERNENVKGYYLGKYFLASVRVTLSRDLKEMKGQPHTHLKEEHLQQRSPVKTEARSRNAFVDVEEQQRIHHGWYSVNGWERDEKGYFIFHFHG